MESRLILREKKIILGVTGCIAAYKAADLLRCLMKLGAEVRVVMTDSAQKFVSPLTFRTLSGNPCYTGMFSPDEAVSPIPHISLSDWADLLLIAPATADIIGKAACGIGDDLLSTLVMSCECTKSAAPAMNTKMWKNKSVTDNVKKLKALGFTIIDPVKGLLACGKEGQGHLAPVEDIVRSVVGLIGKKQDFAGKRILVTAGGTREPIDPVRYIGNRSSGKMGFALAQAAYDRGAEVTIVSAPTSIKPPSNTSLVRVETAREMKEAVFKNLGDSDILVMAAAVADFRPAASLAHKIKKDRKNLALELEPTDDIITEVSRSKGKRTIIGFSVESRDLLANSKKKLKEKGLDLIVANPVSAFDGDESSAVIIDKNGKTHSLPKQLKDKTADAILDKISELAGHKKPAAYRLSPIAGRLKPGIGGQRSAMSG